MFDVEPLSGALGARVDVDLARDLGNLDVDALEDAIAKHGVVTFTDQRLDTDGHVALARLLGEAKLPPPYIPSLAHLGYPEVSEISTENGLASLTDRWHTDVSWEAGPPKYSVVHMQVVPTVGGDTLWSSQHRAFETLSPAMQGFLAGLTARHSNLAGDPGTGSDHPVVCRHPRTGRKALFCNSVFTTSINGVTTDESDALLGMLFAHATRPDFTCRWRWAAGDVAIWDNHFVQHYALSDYGGAARKLHRIEIVGEPPQPVG
jgi:taurine dioxygenase